MSADKKKIFIFKLSIILLVLAIPFGYDVTGLNAFADPADFLTKFGSFGSGDGEFWAPRGATTNDAGNIIVADSGNDHIKIFSAFDGVNPPTFLTKFGSSGSGDGEFSSPRSVTTNDAGNIIVADSDNSRVQIFSAFDGVNPPTFLTKFGSSGSGDGEFNVPQGVTTNDAGNIIVADTVNNRIQIFKDLLSSDTDGDGIFGSADQCPTQPEKFNGYQDSDGCPDVVPAVPTSPDGSTIQTDKQIYESDGENMLIVTGNIERHVRINPVVELTLTGSDVAMKKGVSVKSSGNFVYSFSLPGNEIESGKYSISAKYPEQYIEPVEFGIVTIKPASSETSTEISSLAEDSEPVIKISGNRSVTTENPDGTFVKYKAIVTDIEDSKIEAVCLPKSESIFRVGTTNVICVAEDSAGNKVVEEFEFIVEYEKQNGEGPIININNTNTNINTNEIISTDKEGDSPVDWTTIIVTVITAGIGAIGAIAVKKKKGKKGESAEDNTSSKE